MGTLGWGHFMGTLGWGYTHQHWDGDIGMGMDPPALRWGHWNGDSPPEHRHEDNPPMP